MVKKVKPLHRLSELETAAYAFLRGIDYVVEECPLVAGNTQLRYKEAMNALEATSPGAKAQFFLGYLDRGQAAVPRGRRPPSSDRANDAGSPPPGGSAPSAGPGRRSSASGWSRPTVAARRPRGRRRAVRRGPAGRDLRRRRMTEAAGPFEPGERVLLIDQRDRTYLVQLQARGTYHTHSGTLGHDELIGQPEGTQVQTSKGMVLVAFRPRFADFVLKMPRGAQVDLPEGPRADRDLRGRLPGRAGPGGRAPGRERSRSRSAAPSAPTGRVVSYELRDEHREQARRQHRGVLRRDAADAGAARGRPLARWPRRGSGSTAPCSTCPSRGGRCRRSRGCSSRGASSAPTCPRRSRSSSWCSPLPGTGFQHVETFETLKRGWHVTERSVRPDHRMVGHTGFLTVARLATPAA